MHEEYEPEMIDYVRSTHPGAAILAHPECDPSIIEKTDRVGSTSDMVNYVKQSNKDTFFVYLPSPSTVSIALIPLFKHKLKSSGP